MISSGSGEGATLSQRQLQTPAPAVEKEKEKGCESLYIEQNWQWWHGGSDSGRGSSSGNAAAGEAGVVTAVHR